MLIYAGIAAIGLLFLFVMLFVGEVFGGDHEIGHDVDHGGMDADHGGGPSVFSLRIMSSFLTAFGVGGVVARYYGLSHPVASGVGIMSGLVMSAVVYQFARLLFSQQASSELEMKGLVGTVGEVSVPIPAGGVGQVALTSRGERSEHIARSADGRPLARGAQVIITGLGGDAVVVAPQDGRAAGGTT